MELFGFFNKGKKERERKQKEDEAKRLEEIKKQQADSTTSNNSFLFSKTELKELIDILSKISYVLQKSDRLVGGRNEKMMNVTHSYAGILGYYYENEYHYGKMYDIVDDRIFARYILVEQAMQNSEHRKRTLKELADNWSDELQVIYNLELDSNMAGYVFKLMDADIQKVTKAFEKLSGSKCRRPENPLKLTPYLGDGKVLNRRRFTQEEIDEVNYAEVVKSKSGRSVCFYMKKGGNKYITLDQNSKLGIGERVCINLAEIVIIDKEDDGAVVRVLI